MASKQVEDICEKAIIELVLDFPIYAQLITRIGWVIVDEPNKDVMGWTNGKAIYINAAAVEKFNADPIQHTEEGEEIDCHVGKYEMMFILCHELMHLLGLTFDRGTQQGIYKDMMNEEGRLRWQLWNMATDYEINSLLHNNESTNARGDCVHQSVGNMPDFVLYESKYKDWDAETIYEDLKKDAEREHPQNPNVAQAKENAKNPEFTFDGNNKSGCPQIDEHLPMVDDTTRNEVISKMAEVFGSKTNGTGSSAIDRMIEKAYKPQPFNWRRALTKYIRGWMKDNYTWNKPSRSGIANGLILPSAGKTPKMHIGVAVDTSGSIYDTELHAMMDHLFTILTQFKDFQIDVWCCGSEVYPETLRTYTAGNKSTLHEFEFKSDGGNDMRKNFEYIKEHYKGDHLDTLIIMSDFYDPLYVDKETTSNCPVIYMCLDHPDFTPPALIKGEVYPFVVEKGKNG